MASVRFLEPARLEFGHITFTIIPRRDRPPTRSDVGKRYKPVENIADGAVVTIKELIYV